MHERSGFIMEKIKRVFALILVFALVSVIAPATANAANITDVTATFNGQLIPDTKLIDSTTYLPLRKVCEAVGCTVGWIASSKTVTVSGNGLEMTVGQDSFYLVANGRYIYMNGTAQNVNGTMYVPARPLAKAFGWSVEWDGSAKLTSGSGAIQSGSSFYKEDEVLWLARIISAEAKGESLLGQIAVGNVVLNRVRSSQYPNTIYGVIFDKVGGVQFEPTINGSVWNAPTESAIIAAKLALDGAAPVGNCLFFLNPTIAQSSWIQRNRTFYTRIGKHEFYL